MQAAELAKTKSRLKANGVKGVHVSLDLAGVTDTAKVIQLMNTLLTEHLKGMCTPSMPVGKLTRST